MGRDTERERRIMGKMKDLFLAIQIAIETQDYKQLLKELESVSEEHRAQMLFDVVSSLARWQETEIKEDANR